MGSSSCIVDEMGIPYRVMDEMDIETKDQAIFNLREILRIKRDLKRILTQAVHCCEQMGCTEAEISAAMKK